MAFNRPSLEQLINRTKTDIETRLEIVNASLRNSLTKVFSFVMAGIAHLLHGHLDWISRQIIPDTAEKEHLRRWASIWGIIPVEGTFCEATI